MQLGLTLATEGLIGVSCLGSTSAVAVGVRTGESWGCPARSWRRVPPLPGGIDIFSSALSFSFKTTKLDDLKSHFFSGLYQSLEWQNPGI